MANPKTAKKFADMDARFLVGVESLSEAIGKWGGQASRDKLFKAHMEIGRRYKVEARKRVPVRTGWLKKSIRFTLKRKKGNNLHETAVGSDVDYSIATEFGNKHIAGGRVQALGEGAIIHDGQAIRTWPAKNSQIFHSHGGFKRGKRVKTRTVKVRSITGRVVARPANTDQTQMPWLRPAFTEIRDWVLLELFRAITPPPPTTATSP